MCDKQLDGDWHDARRWVYAVHLRLRRTLVDTTFVCLGLSRTAGITITMFETRPDPKIVVLLREQARYLALDGGTAQRWRGFTMFPRIALPRPVVLPICEPDSDGDDVAPCLVEACCEPDSLLSRRTRWSRNRKVVPLAESDDFTSAKCKDASTMCQAME